MTDPTAISTSARSDANVRSGTQPVSASSERPSTIGISVSGTMTGAQRFLRACLRKPVDVTPVWFLRQAGRYMAEYQAVRRHHSLLEICRTPRLAAEVTITAAEKLDVDARDAGGRTALMFAVLQGRRQAVETLLAAGADPNAADASGTTPLQAAHAGSHPAIAAALEQSGAR